MPQDPSPMSAETVSWPGMLNLQSSTIFFLHQHSFILHNVYPFSFLSSMSLRMFCFSHLLNTAMEKIKRPLLWSSFKVLSFCFHSCMCSGQLLWLTCELHFVCLVFFFVLHHRLKNHCRDISAFLHIVASVSINILQCYA